MDNANRKPCNWAQKQMGIMEKAKLTTDKNRMIQNQPKKWGYLENSSDL